MDTVQFAKEKQKDQIVFVHLLKNKIGLKRV